MNPNLTWMWKVSFFVERGGFKIYTKILKIDTLIYNYKTCSNRLQEKLLLKFCNTYMKTPVLESLFNKFY